MAFNIVAGVNNAVYGSVSGSGSYEENSEVTLEVTVNDGYRFVQWDDGNTDNPRVFSAVADVTLVATLEVIPEYAVTLTANNSNLGSTSGSGNYLEGSTATISATPSLHCRFVKWDDDNTDNPRTLTVNSAVTLEALFETVNWYTISTSVNDDTMGSVTGAGDYDEGDSVTLTAVPEVDHKFTGWSDGNTDNPRTFTASQSLNLSATFAAIIYSDVTIASNDSELGTVSGATSGNIETGSSITLTATPATDCRFDGWQVDGEMLEDTSTTITLTVAENEMDVIAVFSAIVFYQVNLLSSDTDCGHITVVSQTAEPRGVNNNIWPEGTELELQAVCETGGNFLNWGDGDRNLVKYVTVSGNETIRANFYPSTGLILVTKKILQQTWSTIKSFFSASTGASKIGAPANNALGATTLADVVNSVGQPDGIALLNAGGKVAAADIDGTLANDTTGNAATATTASQLGTTTVGASDTPIYLNAGTPTACGNSLAVDITGNAATATSATTASACSGNSATATLATTVKGSYTQSGGKQNPNYFGMNKVGFLMMNTTVNSNTQYKDWIIMDCYSGTDVGGGVAFGVNRQALGAYIMRSAAARTSWAESAELIGTHNYTSYTVKKDGTGASGSWGISITGSSASCTGNAATATTATNSTNSKLTHTVGNTEYPLVFGTSFVITDAQQALRIGTPTATAANCALRCKSYCAAANTQGEAYLVCGNNLAKASANNARGSIYLYGTSTAHTQIVPGNNSTSNVVITLPASTGTLALTSSNITGSSASCTGNAATATSATTATNANNLKVTHTGAAWRDILSCATGFTSASNQAVYGHNSGSVAYYVDANATSGNQRAILRLGNATANTTAAGHNGLIWLYGTSTGYTEIKPGYNSTSSITLTLPAKTGTVALTSDIMTSVFSVAKATANDGTLGDTSANWWYTCNKFSNGVIMMYGFVKCTASSQSKTITFPSDCAPASNNYVAVAIPQRSGAAFTWCSIGAKSTTSFTIQSNSYNGNNWCTGYFFIVIG